MFGAETCSAASSTNTKPRRDQGRIGFPAPSGFEKLFCGRCGSALFSRAPGATDYAGVRLGAIDGDPGVRPQWHQFVDYAAPSQELPADGLPRYPEARPT